MLNNHTGKYTERKGVVLNYVFFVNENLFKELMDLFLLIIPDEKS